jgi:hypothetical protein
MGHRQAQAAALLVPTRRVDWILAGALIAKGKGRRKWRPIMNKSQRSKAYPLP